MYIYGGGARAQELRDLPYSAEVLTSREFLERGTRTFPEALEESAGVGIQKTGPGQGSPFVRGFTGFRNVMVIDGIRLNHSAFREGPNQYWSTIDPYLIERIELIRGPSSVLYGSDSIGGTAIAYSKEPGFKEGTHLHARSLARYASAEESIAAREEFYGNADDFGWFVGGTFRDFNDVDGGKHYGRMEDSGFDEYDGDAKLLYRLSPGSKLVVAAQHHRTNEAPRWHRTADSRSWHGTSAGTERRDDFDQGRNLYYLQFHGNYAGAPVDAVKLNVSLHVQEEKENRVVASGAKQIRELEVETPAAWLQVGKDAAAGYVTAGVEAYLDRVSSSGYDRSAAGVLTPLNRGVVADEGKYLSLGLYLQDEFKIGPLDVTPGIRLTRIEAEADEVDPVVGGSAAPDTFDDDYQAVTGSLRLLYHLDEHWNLIAGWGMGFRAPSFDDSTVVGVAGSGSIDVGGPDLDPEKTHTFDLGVRAQHDRWGATAFAFYTILDEFIQRVPVDIDGVAPIDFQRDNVSEGWVYGFEVAAYFKLTDEVTFFADWGYARGKVDQFTAAGVDAGEQPLGKVPPSLLHVGARYEPKGSAVWVEGLVTSADEQDHLSISDGADPQRIPPKGTPGYTVYTLRGGFRPAEFLSLNAAVENISNKDYRIHGSGQNEPGTNFILGLDVRF
jgi:hemoglobin/transferrin/lactoferrin receptor protein